MPQLHGLNGHRRNNRAAHPDHTHTQGGEPRQNYALYVCVLNFTRILCGDRARGEVADRFVVCFPTKSPPSIIAALIILPTPRTQISGPQCRALNKRPHYSIHSWLHRCVRATPGRTFVVVVVVVVVFGVVVVVVVVGDFCSLWPTVSQRTNERTAAAAAVTQYLRNPFHANVALEA